MKNTIKTFEKIFSILNSCETKEQLDNAYNWGVFVIDRTFMSKFNGSKSDKDTPVSMFWNGYIDVLNEIYEEKLEIFDKIITYCED